MSRQMNKRALVRPPRAGSVVPNPRQRNIEYRNAGTRNVSDPIVADAATGNVALSFTTSAAGNLAGAFSLSARGVQGLTTTNTSTQISAARMPWLYSTSANYMQYRVTRATLIVVGAQSSNTTGSISINSSTDFADATAIGVAGNLLVGGSGFALADLGSNNKRVPLRIDSSWKKVSGLTAYVASGTVVVPSSVDDIIFSTISYSVTGAPASTTVMTMYVEYDVEFKGPISTNTNL